MLGAEGKEKELTAKEQQGTFGGDGNVLYHDCVDVFHLCVMHLKLVDLIVDKVFLNEDDSKHQIMQTA